MESHVWFTKWFNLGSKKFALGLRIISGPPFPKIKVMCFVIQAEVSAQGLQSAHGVLKKTLQGCGGVIILTLVNSVSIGI